jgi:hypothetical protein
MAFKYEEAVPWGRSCDEYLRMFNLNEDGLRRKILGCADGPASFNAGMSKKGFRVVSCDPLYECDAGQIRRRIDATYEDVLAQTRRNQDKFVWGRITSLEELGRVRREAMGDFLGDYDRGRTEGRYVAASLPAIYLSRRHRLSWRCVPTFFSFTRICFRWSFICGPSMNCAGWRWRYGFFPY